MARKRKSNLTLPWERRGGTLGRLVSGQRWKALVAGLVVLIVLLMLWRSADQRARVEETRGVIANVQRAIGEFRADLGRCPRSTTELVHPPRSGRRYLRRQPKDGWGRDLHIECPGHFDPDSAEVISAGPSGSFQSDDNIQ